MVNLLEHRAQQVRDVLGAEGMPSTQVIAHEATNTITVHLNAEGVDTRTVYDEARVVMRTLRAERFHAGFMFSDNDPADGDIYLVVYL